jgi:transcriptional regulator with PAS, ATPase and Fis domain
VLQERQLRRLGDVVSRRLDLRVIAATNCDLAAMVHKSEFREDLYYRLNVFTIQVPPLRHRLDDVPLLVHHFLRNRKTVAADAIEKLCNYSYPGNVRELENIVEAAIYTAHGVAIHADDIALPSQADNGRSDEELIVGNFWDSVATPFSERLITRNQVERVIRRGLEQTRGSYKKLLPLFQIPESDYKRFMDFLRRSRCNVDFRQFRNKE